MKVTRVELMAVTASEKQYPPEGPPEIAFAGRSNVGKSSLLNYITGRKSLARVSGSPGKTRTINFYSVNGDQFRIVDLPGYGYARVSKSESQKWGGMIEEYLMNRSTLKGVALLCDIRHEPSVQDVQMYEWLKHYELEGCIVATKSDKIPRSALQRHVQTVRKTLGAGEDIIVVPVSALKRTGAAELLKETGKILAADR